MTGLSIRRDGTRNGAVFLISRPDQRNGSRAFIPPVCRLLRRLSERVQIRGIGLHPALGGLGVNATAICRPEMLCAWQA